MKPVNLRRTIQTKLLLHTFSSSERWIDYESESDVSLEIWNEIETEIAAGEGKGNENVSVGEIWTETLI